MHYLLSKMGGGRLSLQAAKRKRMNWLHSKTKSPLEKTTVLSTLCVFAPCGKGKGHSKRTHCLPNIKKVIIERFNFQRATLWLGRLRAHTHPSQPKRKKALLKSLNWFNSLTLRFFFARTKSKSPLLKEEEGQRKVTNAPTLFSSSRDSILFN